MLAEVETSDKTEDYTNLGDTEQQSTSIESNCRREGDKNRAIK